MAQEDHKAEAPERVSCFVVTVSDTRGETDDYSGALVKELLESNFHFIVGTQVVPDDPEKIQRLLEQAVGHEKIEAIIMTGGTGVSPRDNTHETLVEMFDKKIDGFGEIFRTLSYQDIGPAAMLSRATAGVIDKCLVFSIPGAVGAVKLALSELILPELGHLVYEVSKEGGAPAGDVATEADAGADEEGLDLSVDEAE